MSMIFGDFIENLPPSQEYLILNFSPGSIPLQQRWRNNCLSADFLADYFSTFLPCSDSKSNSSIKGAEIKSAVSYIANELLENAMKYSNKKSIHPISIQLHLNKDNIIFQLTNSINGQLIDNFKLYIKELITADPLELYIHQLEKNAVYDNEGESGLGFLTMINDYGAKLGWKFQPNSSITNDSSVITMVQLKI